MRRHPIANLALIAATCAVSGYLLLTGKEPSWAISTPGSFDPASLVGSLFAHGDWMHLIGNMLFLFIFGNAVNAKMGQLTYLALYLLVGVIEGLLWVVFGSAPAVGASGAIMGVVGAFLVFFPRNQVSFWIAWLDDDIEISAFWVIGSYFVFDLWGLVSDGAGGIAYLSHVVGAVAGFGLTLGSVAIGLFQSEGYEQNLLEATGMREHPNRG